MTDRTPPQERERLAREACFVRFRDHESLRSLRAQKDDDTNDLLDAYAAAVAARVRAELREKVEGMRDAYRHATDCTRPEVACHCSAGDVHDFANDVLAALAEETTG